MVSPTLVKQKLALNLGLKSELNLGVVGGGRTGRKGDGDGDKSGEEGESEHDAVGVGVVVGGVSDEVGNELMAVGGGGGDLYQHATTTGCTVASHPSPRTRQHRQRQRCPRARASNNPQLPPSTFREKIAR